jgi:hypothetical protein
MVAAAASTASQVTPGLLGFLVVAGMGLALFFLFRSLNKQLHKITPDGPGRKRAKLGRGRADDPRADDPRADDPGGPAT